MEFRRRPPGGFTIIELLVVIGIIAVLVAISMPSIEKARSRASLVYCQSNLRTIGQLIRNYATDNNDYAPPSWSMKGFWSFGDVLSLMAERPKVYVKASDLPPGFPNGANGGYSSAAWQPVDELGIFHDVDLPPAPWAPRQIAYIANPRVLGVIDGKFWDPAIGHCDHSYAPRKLAAIHRPQEVMTVWDSAVNISFGVNFGVYRAFAETLDNFAMTTDGAHGFSYPTAPSRPTMAAPPFMSAYYSNLIALGGNAYPGGRLANPASWLPVSVTPAYLKAVNVDHIDNGQSESFSNRDANNMRFRHMRDTEANFLFVDGHVDSRSLGTVIAKDVCCNPN